ncbi:hypothetical protein WJU23_13265 [Prosthecobacter sp. SYSU 5D2]|uniref:hypothetical protein n=1 Tax=Prosthecobacter sp. SYSU 5D2 TaxID=3134134 RepID=UPI0031FEC849
MADVTPANQHPLLPRLARWMLVALLCISLGLQWTLLQGVAWTGMLISYARDGSLIEAVTKTFDGEHPCQLCKAVENGQKQDQEKTASAPLKKLEAVLAQMVCVVAPAPVLRTFPEPTQQGERLAMMPPWTPPRQGQA